MAKQVKQLSIKNDALSGASILNRDEMRKIVGGMISAACKCSGSTGGNGSYDIWGTFTDWDSIWAEATYLCRNAYGSGSEAIDCFPH